VTYDYGADDAWIALTKHCADAREPQYTYRLCLFDKSAQVDNNAGHETSLGTWRGFEKGYTEVRLGGGGAQRRGERRTAATLLRRAVAVRRRQAGTAAARARRAPGPPLA
jgi:hypothetical protein